MLGRIKILYLVLLRILAPFRKACHILGGWLHQVKVLPCKKINRTCVQHVLSLGYLSSEVGAPKAYTFAPRTMWYQTEEPPKSM